MGVGWRRVTEKVRQTVGVDKTFPATSNGRNEAMLREAGDFANHLKRCEKDIRALKISTEGLINTTKIVMSAPLPRVYESGEGGKAMPVATAPGQPGIIGGDFKLEDLTKASKETSKKLDSEVLAPMQRWTTAYNTVQGRMKRLEGVRLEVDSRQRTVNSLTTNLNKQRAGLPPNPAQTRTKNEIAMDSTIRKLTNKDNKLAATRQSFKEQEALVYQQLAQLIRDAVWLKSYLAAVMRLEQEAFTISYMALGTAKGSSALPLHETSAMAGTPEHTGMIPAARPIDTPPQAAGPGIGRSVATKIATKRMVGKENGTLPAQGKDYDLTTLPAAPTHPVPPQRRTESRGYDRYGDQYAQRDAPPMTAW